MAVGGTLVGGHGTVAMRVGPLGRVVKGSLGAESIVLYNTIGDRRSDGGGAAGRVRYGRHSAQCICERLYPKPSPQLPLYMFCTDSTVQLQRYSMRGFFILYTAVGA